jgi:6-phosphogluconolactonase
MRSSAHHLRVFEDPAALASAAAAEFYRRAAEAIAQRQRFACALSGGSTPLLCFERLVATAPAAGLSPGFWNFVHFFWGDERDVPPDHQNSNFRLAREGLFSKIDIPQRNLHRMKPEAAGALAAAPEYESDLRSFFGLRAGEFPRFDLIFLGMGEDGHTASIFPYSPVVRETTRLVAAPWVEQLQSFRITLTLPAINNAACAIFLVSGQAKSAILHEVLHGDRDHDRLPAQSIHLLNGEVLWFVDRAAAGS